MCGGVSEVESDASERATRPGEEVATVPAETPSQTIERVEAFMRWLCQVRQRCVRFSLLLSLDVVVFCTK